MWAPAKCFSIRFFYLLSWSHNRKSKLSQGWAQIYIGWECSCPGSSSILWVLALWPVLKCFEKAGTWWWSEACLSQQWDGQNSTTYKGHLSSNQLTFTGLRMNSRALCREKRKHWKGVGNKRGSPRACLMSVVAAPMFHPHPSPPSLSCSLTSPSLFQAKSLCKFSLFPFYDCLFNSLINDLCGLGRACSVVAGRLYSKGGSFSSASLWCFCRLYENNSPNQQVDELETSCLMTEEISTNWTVYWNIVPGSLAWLQKKLASVASGADQFMFLDTSIYPKRRLKIGAGLHYNWLLTKNDSVSRQTVLGK